MRGLNDSSGEGPVVTGFDKETERPVDTGFEMVRNQ